MLPTVRPDLPFNMLGTDVFGLVSGITGIAVITVSLCTWLLPRRRLRSLDTTMEKAILALAVIQEEHAVLDRTIVLRAHEMLYWCVKSPGHVPNDGQVDSQRVSARQQAACFRIHLLNTSSLWSTVLATFSPLPLKITKLRRQVQTVLDQLQVSDSGMLYMIIST
jgi:hypothetical protein